MKRCAVISCKGLGDGLAALVLSNNLHLNGYEVDTFHSNHLDQLQEWFYHLPILPFSKIGDVDLFLSSYDLIFVSYDSSCPVISKIISLKKNNYRKKIFVLNPCPSRKIGSQPFYEDTYFSPFLSVVENIEIFCKKIFKLSKTTTSNGVVIPNGLVLKKYSSRVIIHPTSAKRSKNWSAKKYLLLADKMVKNNLKPVFVLSEKEKNDISIFKNYAKPFKNLHDLACYIYESGSMIGNDSGIGHLASLFGLPTIILFRNWRTAKLWRPSWTRGIVVYPFKYIVNFSFMRIRDKYWQKFISVKKIFSLICNINN